MLSNLMDLFPVEEFKQWARGFGVGITRESVHEGGDTVARIEIEFPIQDKRDDASCILLKEIEKKVAGKEPAAALLASPATR